MILNVRGRAVGCTLFLIGCGAGSRSKSPSMSARDTSPGAAESVASHSREPVTFDPAAAKRSIDAVDVSSCQSLPPFADETLHLRVVFEPRGVVRSATVDMPFAGSPFGECIER